MRIQLVEAEHLLGSYLWKHLPCLQDFLINSKQKQQETKQQSGHLPPKNTKKNTQKQKSLPPQRKHLPKQPENKAAKTNLGTTLKVVNPGECDPIT